MSSTGRDPIDDSLIEQYYRNKEWNTDRVPVCEDKGARIFRFIIAGVLWFLAIAMGVKAIILWLAPT